VLLHNEREWNRAVAGTFQPAMVISSVSPGKCKARQNISKNKKQSKTNKQKKQKSKTTQPPKLKIRLRAALWPNMQE